MDEEQTAKGTDTAIEDTDEGDKPQTNTIVDDTNLAAKRLEEANKETKELLIRQEENYSKMKLGGTAEGGIAAEKPKVLTDTEYAEALERGEVNPLAEDGIFK